MKNKKLISYWSKSFLGISVLLVVIIVFFIIFFLFSERQISKDILKNLDNCVSWNMFILLSALLLLLFSGLYIFKFIYSAEHDEYRKNQDFRRKLILEKIAHAHRFEEFERQREKSLLLKMKDTFQQENKLLADRQTRFFYFLASKSLSEDLNPENIKEKVEGIKKEFEEFNRLMDGVEKE